MSPSSVPRHIRHQLPLTAVPGLPDLQLHLAGPKSRLGPLLGPEGRPPYWAYLWGGGLALLDHLQAGREKIAGRCVLDLGSGSGLLALAALRMGAKRAIAVDTDPIAAAAIGLNAEANGLCCDILTDDLTAAGYPVPEADLVLAGDIFYDDALVLPMLGLLRRFSSLGADILIGDPDRKPLPRAELVELWRTRVADFGGERRSAGVFRLK